MNAICRFSILLVAVFGVVLWGTTSHALKVYIDIDSPGYRPLPVAIVVVPAPAGTQPCKDIKWEKEFKAVIQQDMEISGFFQVLPPEKHLVDSREMALYPEKIDFRAWYLIGAEALILLQVSCQGETVLCEAQLLDVLTGKLQAWKRYRSRSSGARRVAHRFANEVEKEMTGVAGAFDTSIAYVSEATGSKELYVMDYDGNAPKRVTRLHSMLLSPAWSPNGVTMAFTSYRNGPPEIYLMDMRAPSRTARLLPGFAPLCSGAAWSPNGKRLAFSASRGDKNKIYCMPPQPGTKPKQITQGVSIDVSPSWSPNGEQIVFVSNRSGHPDLHVMDEEGTGIKRITFNGSYNADPDWSPRGDWIVYVSQMQGRFQIFRIRPDGTQMTQLTREFCDHVNPSWSPNGRLIAFSSDLEGNFDIYLIRMDGSGLRKLSNGKRDETEPSWSPRMGD